MSFTPGQKLITWVSPKILTAPSPIHGRGMFAKQPISTGETVIIWGGIVIEEKDLSSGKFDPNTACRLTDTLYLVDDSAKAEPIDYFLNHSCDSNLWMADEITLIARRAIAIDEEVTFDYALWEYYPDWELKVCTCGSPLCRGKVTGNDWTMPIVQRLYAKHFSPRLRRLIDAQKWP